MQRTKLSEQVRQHVEEKQEAKPIQARRKIISTGSTLLDLAISGGVYRGGGLPGGILAEIFGPPSCGKTVLLCEIAGNIQRQGGEVSFFDPEARLNKQFARLFDLDIQNMTYGIPNTVPQVFGPIRKWEPQPVGKIHGVFADSLAALSTQWELEDKDQYGMRRAKEFSEELRKTCRIITNSNYLMVCSNQVRENVDSGPYAPKHRSTGGLAIGFYASLRLRFLNPQKIKIKKKVKGKEISRVVGVDTEVEVYKSSIWKPFHVAPLTIIFDYGIDDIRQNLKFVKETRGQTQYTVQGTSVSRSLEEACALVETQNLERDLRNEVIDLWLEIEEQFTSERKPKYRGN